MHIHGETALLLVSQTGTVMRVKVAGVSALSPFFAVLAAEPVAHHKLLRGSQVVVQIAITARLQTSPVVEVVHVAIALAADPRLAIELLGNNSRSGGQGHVNAMALVIKGLLRCRRRRRHRQQNQGEAARRPRRP
jgi:hypothetical protein